MNRNLADLREYIKTRITEVQGQADFELFLTSLIHDLNEQSESRLDMREIVARMFERLNADENGEPRPRPYDARWTSPAFQTMSPIAVSLSDIAVLVRILKSSIYVYTAIGRDLDLLGREFDFPRNEATQAIREGRTYTAAMTLSDFPIGSRFETRDSIAPNIFTIIETQNGIAHFRSEKFGTVGNTYYGELNPATPINNLGRALISDGVGAIVPGQDAESDEEYRHRFLQFLRNRAYGWNVPQYQQEVRRIDGVGNLMVFPVWRGDGTVNVSVADATYSPISDSFAKYINDRLDPITRSGTGIGLVAVGHRTTVTTPKWKDVTISLRAVLSQGASKEQAKIQLDAILEKYFEDIRKDVFDEWERTYYSNVGVGIAYVDMVSRFEAIAAKIQDAQIGYELMDLAKYFPAEAAKQTHTFYTIIHPQVIGVNLINSRAVTAVDFPSMSINGEVTAGGYRIEQTQDVQFLPRLIEVELDIVDYIQPADPPIPPAGLAQMRYYSGFDKPVSELVEVIE